MTVVELTDAIAAAPMRYAADGALRLQCSRTLGVAACAALDAFLHARPDSLLRVYKARGSAWSFDPSFLARLPSLRRLWIDADAGDLVDLAALDAVPAAIEELTLDTLAVGSSKGKDKPKQSVESLRRFASLRTLAICGALRDLGFLAGFAQLRTLVLWRCKLRSLAGLEHAHGLADLQLHASGAKDLSPLAELVSLRSLEVHDQRTMTDLSPLGRLASLERLWIVSCGTALALPSLAGCPALKVLVVDKLATPANLERIASAPALRCLVLSGCPSLHDVDALAPLAGHPALRELRIESGDERLYRAIRDRYGWKVDYCNYPAGEYLD